jgi:hypothetical protein
LFGRPAAADHLRETVDAALALSERVAIDVVAPRWEAADRSDFSP